MRALLAALLLFVLAAPVSAADVAPDGAILGTRPYAPPIESYEALVARMASAPRPDARDGAFDEAAFRRARPPELFDALKSGDVEAQRIVYASDGLKIEGYLLQPARREGRLPVIVFARGGNRNFGEIGMAQMLDMAGWARRGYIVLATNYRGSSRSEGQDEYGGADVNDLLALFETARTLPHADTANMYLIGVSRGGMMVFRAIAEGAPVRAAAVVGGAADLHANAQGRPQMAAIYSELMPDHAAEAANRFCRRSAVCWPEKITVPVLLLHGEADWRVDVADARRLAEGLKTAGRPHDLVVYPGDDHPLNANMADAWDRALNLFAANRG